jgi:hypothetical protein
MTKKTRRALRKAVKTVSRAAALIAIETVGSAAGSLLKDVLKKRTRVR